MPLPNFFIIGAPKAGTTALHATLSQHPDIYLSAVKEPCFFACEGQPPLAPGPAGSYLHHEAVWQPRKYLQLFAGVASERAIGEASPMYLRSPQAAARIRRDIPHAKIIAILRQPAERAHSHFWHMVQKGLETVSTFEMALEQESQRRDAGWFSAFYYRANGFYYQQLAAYYDLFPRAQIKVFGYEDWKNHPANFLRDVLRFLEVDDTLVPPVREANLTRLPRSRRFHALAQAATQRGPMPDKLSAPSFLPPQRALASTLDWLNRNVNLVPPPPLHTETRQFLTQGYRADILKLEELLGRDLSAWLDNESIR